MTDRFQKILEGFETKGDIIVLVDLVLQAEEALKEAAWTNTAKNKNALNSIEEFRRS